MNTLINVTVPYRKRYVRSSAPLPTFSVGSGWKIYPCIPVETVDLIHCNVISKKTPAVTVGYVKLKKKGVLLKPLAYLRLEARTSTSWLPGWFKEYSSYGPVGGYAGGSWLQKQEMGLVYESGTWPILSTLSTADLIARADRIAINKLLLGIKDQKANLVQTYAEAHQLQKLVGETTRKLARTFSALRAGRLLVAAQVLGLRVGKREAKRYAKRFRQLKTDADIDKMLSTGVLAVQYGIRPLIKDVIGAAELFAQKTAFEVVNTFESRGLAFGNSSGSKTSDYTGSTTITNVIDVRQRCTVKYGCAFASGSEMNHTLAQLGFSNPLLLAWELLPWSFVIDWFIPVGNYLSAIDATLGLTFKSGWKSVRHSNVTQRSMAWRPKVGRPDQFSYCLGEACDNQTTESFERVVLTGFPVSRLPDFKNPLSWEHALNGIALLAGFKKTVYRPQKE